MPNFKKNTNPVMKRSCYKMKGFSGFGNSPVTKMDPMHNGKPGVQKEDFAQFKSSPATFKGANSKNSKCWKGCKKVGTKISSRTGRRVNDCDCGSKYSKK